MGPYLQQEPTILDGIDLPSPVRLGVTHALCSYVSDVVVTTSTNMSLRSYYKPPFSGVCEVDSISSPE